jgi:MarR family transcriptional regulator for hemolysin
MTVTTAQTKAPRKAKIQPQETDANGVKRPIAKQFRFGYLVHDVSRIRRSVMDEVMRPYDITRAQWSMLSTLSRGGNNGMTQVDIARLLEVGKVTVGGLIDRLEVSGQVERRADAVDRRAKRVYITEKGYEVIGLMISVASKVNRRVLKGLTPIEIETVERALLQVKRNLKEIAEEAAAAGATPNAKPVLSSDEADADFGE